MSKVAAAEAEWTEIEIATNNDNFYIAYANPSFLESEGEPLVPVSYAISMVMPDTDRAFRTQLKAKYRDAFPTYVSSTLASKIAKPGYRPGKANFGALCDFRVFIYRVFGIYDEPENTTEFKTELMKRLWAITPEDLVPADYEILQELETSHETRYLEANRARFDRELRSQILQELISKTN
jgi:hypothetical protein